MMKVLQVLCKFGTLIAVFLPVHGHGTSAKSSDQHQHAEKNDPSSPIAVTAMALSNANDTHNVTWTTIANRRKRKRRGSTMMPLEHDYFHPHQRHGHPFASSTRHLLETTTTVLEMADRPVIPYDCAPCLDRYKANLVAFLPTANHEDATRQMTLAMQEVARSMNIQLRIQQFDDAEETMADAIRQLADEFVEGSPQDRIRGLIVSLPTRQVQDAVQYALDVTNDQLPIFGVHQGLDNNPTLIKRLMNFVAMDEFQAGRQVGEQLKSQYWKQDTVNSTTARRVLFVTTNPYPRHWHPLQQRYNGLEASLRQHDVSNVTIDTVLSTNSDDNLQWPTHPAACPYDAIILADPALLPAGLRAYNHCQFRLVTFGTNPAVYDAMAQSQLSFTIASDYYLQASLIATLAGLYATTGTTLLRPTDDSLDAPPFYAVAPRVIHVNNMQRDSHRACEAIGFPSCNHGEIVEGETFALHDHACPCHDRSQIRIAAVYQNNPVFSLSIAAARQAGHDLGITLELNPLDLRGTRQEKDWSYAEKIRALCRDHVDGIITSIREPIIAEAVAECQSLQIPVMGLTPIVPQAAELLTQPIPVIGMDEFHAGYTMGRVLLERGMKYGFCMNWKASVQLQPRCDGFELALLEHNADGGAIYYYGGVIHGKSDNRILNRDIMEQYIQPRLNAILDKDNNSTRSNNNTTRWDHVGVFMQGSAFVTGATYAQEHHPGLLLALIEHDDDLVYEALRQGKIVATMDHQHYLRGYLPVPLLTWLRQTRQSVSANSFLATGPIVMRQVPSHEELTCRAHFFETCPKHQEKNHLGVGIRAVGYLVLIVIVGVACGFMYWVHANREQRIVKASQPEFLVAICVGCIVMASSIIPMSLDDGVLEDDGGCVGCTCTGCDVACMTAPWLMALGFTFIFASLHSKIWRMNRLINGAAHFRRLKLEVKDVIIPLVILLTLNAILLLVWSLVDPMYWEREHRCGADDFTSYGICRVGKTGVSSAMALSLIIVNIMAVIMANYQAYQARNFSTEYSESKYIALAMISIFQVSIVGLPLSFLVTDSPSAWFLIRGFFVAVVTMSVLLLMFLPKIRKLREAKDKKRQSLIRREEAQNAYQIANGIEPNNKQGGSNDGGSDSTGSRRSALSSMSGGSQRSGLRIRQRIVNMTTRLSRHPHHHHKDNDGVSQRTTPKHRVIQTSDAPSGTHNTHRPLVSSVSMDMGTHHSHKHPPVVAESSGDDSGSDSEDDDDEQEGVKEEKGLRLSASAREEPVPLDGGGDDDGDDREGGLRVSVTKEAAQFLANSNSNLHHENGALPESALQNGHDDDDEESHSALVEEAMMVDQSRDVSHLIDTGSIPNLPDVTMVDPSRDVSHLIDTGSIPEMQLDQFTLGIATGGGNDIQSPDAAENFSDEQTPSNGDMNQAGYGNP